MLIFCGQSLQNVTELLVILSGDIELNPGSEKEKSWELINPDCLKDHYLPPYSFWCT